MKQFLPLLMLTGLLFGQESTIVLKDGKTIKGTIVSEEEYEYTVQVVKVYGYSRYEKIKILKSDIVTIESEIDTTEEKDKRTNIDIPKEIEPFDFNSNILPKNIVSKQEIINMSKDEKDILYGKYKVNPFGNTAISFFVPTLGYHRINQWKKRGRSCIYIYLACGMAIELAVKVNNGLSKSSSYETEWRRKHIKDENAILDKFIGIFMPLHLFDVFTQTIKYNRNVYKYIFGQEAP